MAKFRSIKNSLIAGEISPTAFGRTDLQQYPHACKLLRNMIPYLSGGAYRRPGSFFESKFDGSTDYAPRLIPFVVSRSEAYQLAFGKVIGGNGFVTFFRPTSNTSTSESGLVTGTHPYAISTVGTASSIGNYDEIHDVQYVQSADVLYLVHPNHKPMRVTRTAVDIFKIDTFDAGLTGTTCMNAWPYLDQNKTNITLKPSAASGNDITLTASAALFSPLHVGAVFKLNHSGGHGACVVKEYISSTQVKADIFVTFAATSATLTWWESAWSDYRGWPRSVALFRQRICYGGTKHQPDSIVFSQSGDYDQLSIFDRLSEEAGNGATGSDPFRFTILSNELNQIQWLSAKRTLVAGTLGQEYVIDNAFSSTSTGFGGDNVSAVSDSSFGSSYQQPVRIGAELIFTSSAGDEIKSLVFDDKENSYVAESIQAFFDHYPKVETSTGNRKFRAFAWDRSRSTLWCCDTAGNIFAMTRDRKLGVTAWHSHQMGGYDSSLTGGSVGAGLTLTADPAYSVCSGSAISVSVIPNPTIGTDDVWLVVKRKINGVFEYHVERIIGRNFAYDSAYGIIQNGIGNYFVDASTYDTNDYPLQEAFTFTGLDHLEGEIPEGTASNAHGLFTITGSPVLSGETTIQHPYPSSFEAEPCIVVFGLGFNSIIAPVQLEAGSQIGTSHGAIKRITKITIRFVKTMFAKVGRDKDNLEIVNFRKADTPMGKSADLFTGDKTIDFTGDYDTEGGIYLVQDKPLPFGVVSIIAEGQTYD